MSISSATDEMTEVTPAGELDSELVEGLNINFESPGWQRDINAASLSGITIEAAQALGLPPLSTDWRTHFPSPESLWWGQFTDFIEDVVQVHVAAVQKSSESAQSSGKTLPPYAPFNLELAHELAFFKTLAEEVETKLNEPNGERGKRAGLERLDTSKHSPSVANKCAEAQKGVVRLVSDARPDWTLFQQAGWRIYSLQRETALSEGLHDLLDEVGYWNHPDRPKGSTCKVKCVTDLQNLTEDFKTDPSRMKGLIEASRCLDSMEWEILNASVPFTKEMARQLLDTELASRASTS